MPRRPAVVAAVLLALALSLSSSPGVGSQISTPDGRIRLSTHAPERMVQRVEGERDLREVQALLDERMRALGAGDKTAWMATVWTGAPEPFRVGQARLFDGLRSVPFERYELAVDDESSLDLGPAVAARYPGHDVSLPAVRQRLRIDGADDRDDVATLWLTFVEDGGRWHVAADDDLDALGLDTERGIWDAGPVQVTRDGAATVLHHSDMRQRVPELLAVTNEAIDVLRERWPGEWSQHVVVLLPSSQDELRRIMQTTLDLDKFVAFVTYEIDRDDGWEPTVPRVLIQDANLRRYSRGGKVETLVHELVHAAGASLAGPFQPTWVHEGLAEWIAKGAIPERTRLSGGFPLDHEFVSGAQTAILGAYGRSTTAMARIADARGADAPFELYRELGSRRVTPGDTDHHLDEALRAVTGVDAAGLAELLSR